MTLERGYGSEAQRIDTASSWGASYGAMTVPSTADMRSRPETQRDAKEGNMNESDNEFVSRISHEFMKVSEVLEGANAASSTAVAEASQDFDPPPSYAEWFTDGHKSTAAGLSELQLHVSELFDKRKVGVKEKTLALIDFADVLQRGAMSVEMAQLLDRVSSEGLTGLAPPEFMAYLVNHGCEELLYEFDETERDPFLETADPAAVRILRTKLQQQQDTLEEDDTTTRQDTAQTNFQDVVTDAHLNLNHPDTTYFPLAIETERDTTPLTHNVTPAIKREIERGKRSSHARLFANKPQHLSGRPTRRALRSSECEQSGEKETKYSRFLHSIKAEKEGLRQRAPYHHQKQTVKSEGLTAYLERRAPYVTKTETATQALTIPEGPLSPQPPEDLPHRFSFADVPPLNVCSKVCSTTPSSRMPSLLRLEARESIESAGRWTEPCGSQGLLGKPLQKVRMGGSKKRLLPSVHPVLNPFLQQDRRAARYGVLKGVVREEAVVCLAVAGAVGAFVIMDAVNEAIEDLAVLQNDKLDPASKLILSQLSSDRELLNTLQTVFLNDPLKEECWKIPVFSECHALQANELDQSAFPQLTKAYFRSISLAD